MSAPEYDPTGWPPARVAEILAAWREAAVRLDRYAESRRREGDPREAQDAEEAAQDYRLAADDLEARSRSAGLLGPPTDA